MSNEKMSSGSRDTLRQLFMTGPTWDGNLISKQGRTDLVNNRMASRACGYNFLTAKGVEEAIRLGMDREKEKPKSTKFPPIRVVSTLQD